uniref:Uncharacterized protein n=1 Tax=Myotis myotis TaxID=51298 RepID=A0A7J8ALR9_MYOMY|nr:hypothetical protein mMyoMyo1_007979 [Myotis myotis]
MINSAPFTLLSQLRCYMIWSSVQKTSTTRLTKAAPARPVPASSQSSRGVRLEQSQRTARVPKCWRLLRHFLAPARAFGMLTSRLLCAPAWGWLPAGPVTQDQAENGNLQSPLQGQKQNGF